VITVQKLDIAPGVAGAGDKSGGIGRSLICAALPGKKVDQKGSGLHSRCPGLVPQSHVPSLAQASVMRTDCPFPPEPNQGP
jgi:hypothetical protein